MSVQRESVLEPIGEAPADGAPQANSSEWMSSDGYDRAIVVATFVYLIAVGGAMVAHDNMFSPDQFFLLALAGMFVVGRAKAFLWDWTPPVLLLLAYDSLRGVVPHLTNRAHILPMIDFDEGLFGKCRRCRCRTNSSRPDRRTGMTLSP